MTNLSYWIHLKAVYNYKRHRALQRVWYHETSGNTRLLLLYKLLAVEYDLLKQNASRNIKNMGSSRHVVYTTLEILSREESIVLLMLEIHHN